MRILSSFSAVFPAPEQRLARGDYSIFVEEMNEKSDFATSLCCGYSVLMQDHWGVQECGHKSRICVQTFQNTTPNQDHNSPKLHKEENLSLPGFLCVSGLGVRQWVVGLSWCP